MLVVNYHGFSSNAAEQVALTGMNPVADANNFIVAYPDGLGSGWNAGDCCTELQPPNVDDVQFTKDLLSLIESEYCIDPARIYATGMSNGGFMSHLPRVHDGRHLRRRRPRRGRPRHPDPRVHCPRGPSRSRTSTAPPTPSSPTTAGSRAQAPAAHRLPLGPVDDRVLAQRRLVPRRRRRRPTRTATPPACAGATATAAPTSSSARSSATGTSGRAASRCPRLGARRTTSSRRDDAYRGLLPRPPDAAVDRLRGARAAGGAQAGGALVRLRPPERRRPGG